MNILWLSSTVLTFLKLNVLMLLTKFLWKSAQLWYPKVYNSGLFCITYQGNPIPLTMKQYWSYFTYNNRQWWCNQYNKVFTQNSKVLSLLNTSNADKLYQCNQCNKSFSDKSDFTKHLKSHQSKYYLYHCIHCDKAFTHKGSLIRHQKIHNGEKSYQYSQCDKAFAKNMGL